MLSKAKLRLILSLHQKKYRKEHKLFIVEGEKLVDELLQSAYRLHTIFATKTWLDEVTVKYKIKRELLVEISENDLKKISSLSTPNKVLVIVHTENNTVEIAHLRSKLTLVLDGINDPGNLGTLIRIADWFGIDNIICSNETVDLYNPKTIQATMGSLFRVNVTYQDLEKWIPDYKAQTNNLVYGTLLHGESLYKKKLLNNGLLIIGSESHGISDSLLQLIDEKIKIPAFSENKTGENILGRKSGAESLNAAIAAAIVIAEFRRTVSEKL
jgi:TrmH family RNA methyltransferase